MNGARTGARGTGRRRLVAAASLAVAAAAAPATTAGQETAFRLPFGSAAVVLPVQSVLPLPGGGLPGSATGEEDALRTMDAELSFALAERRASRQWALPDDLRRRVRRNPMLTVDPDRVAYQGLLGGLDRSEQIYEPLHGELRTLAALFGTRYVILPLRLRVTEAGEPAGVGEADGADAAARDTPACGDADRPQRPELMFALIDIRRSAVLWQGSVSGPAACPGSGGLLAGLAAAVAGHLTES